MAEVMHPVGMLPDGTIVHVRDPRVLRGLASGIRCLTCQQPFVARQGAINAWHFAHQADNPGCGGSVMSDAHRYAQQILLNARLLSLPARFAHARGYPDRMVTPALPARYTEPTITGRVRRPSYVLDALVSLEPTAQPLGIEVRYRHAVDAEKQNKIQQDNLAVVEIDIATVQSAVVYDPSLFANYVLHGAPRHWLHLPEQASLDAAYQAELDAATERQRQLAAAAAHDRAQALAAQRAAAETQRAEAERVWREQQAEYNAAAATAAAATAVADAEAETLATHDAMVARMTHADALRRWHLREPPYDNPSLPAPRL